MRISQELKFDHPVDTFESEIKMQFNKLIERRSRRTVTGLISD